MIAALTLRVSACPSCSRDVAEGFAFCPHCGAALGPDAAAAEERKLVTLLFADVSEAVITSLERLEAPIEIERARQLMARAT